MMRLLAEARGPVGGCPYCGAKQATDSHYRDLGAVVLLMDGSLAVPRSLPAPDVPPLAGLFWPWRGTVLVLCDPDARVTMVAS
jgi:hypothetical protein